MGINWHDFFIVGNPLILGSQIAILLTMIGIVAGVTYLKNGNGFGREWLTTVDHKRIGIMYILSAVLMFFRVV